MKCDINFSTNHLLKNNANIDDCKIVLHRTGVSSNRFRLKFVNTRPPIKLPKPNSNFTPEPKYTSYNPSMDDKLYFYLLF